MPALLLVGLLGTLVGGGAVYEFSDSAKSLVKWVVIGGIVYIVLKSGVLKKVAKL